MDTRPPAPPEMAYIRDCRGRMSVRQAAGRAGISEARWRQLEAGGREIQGRWVSERANDDALARMALAVDALPDKLRLAGREGAARALERIAAEAEAARAADLAEAERLVSLAERPLSPRQKGALVEQIAAALAELRGE